MPNYNIDPQKAINNLLLLFEAKGIREIQIEPDSAQEDQFYFIANLPEAQGIIGYDTTRHILYLIKGQN